MRRTIDRQTGTRRHEKTGRLVRTKGKRGRGTWKELWMTDESCLSSAEFTKTSSL